MTMDDLKRLLIKRSESNNYTRGQTCPFRINKCLQSCPLKDENNKCKLEIK